jgi:hypothetical protein
MGTFPISRNVWHDIAVEITWSRGGSGRARVFLDNATASVREARGTNMHNAFQHYMKLGMYRNAEIRGDTWVQLGDISARRVPKP